MPGQFTGLQVANSLAHIAERMLGNVNSVKCVVEDDQSIYVGCVAQLLQNLDIQPLTTSTSNLEVANWEGCYISGTVGCVQHPVGHIINSAVQAHHERYHCATKTLVFMLGLWARHAQWLLDQGVPVEAVVQLSREAILKCIDNLEAITISLDGNCGLYMYHRQSMEEGHTKEKDEETDITNVENQDVNRLYSTVNTVKGTTDQDGYDEVCLEDEDDLSWYFEGDPQGVSVTDQATEQLIHEATDTLCALASSEFDNFSKYPDISASSQIGSDSRSGDDVIKKTVWNIGTTLSGPQMTNSQFSSLLDSEKAFDSDFDSCFDDVPESTSGLKEDLSFSSMNDQSMNVRDVKLGANTCLPGDCSSQCEETDEFADCFKDAEYEIACKPSTTKISEEKGRNSKEKNFLEAAAPFTDQNDLQHQKFVPLDIKERTSVSHCENVETHTHSLPLEDLRDDLETAEKSVSLEDLIKKRVQEKSQQLHGKVLNRSRHFKTIQSSVCEMDRLLSEDREKNVSCTFQTNTNESQTYLSKTEAVSGAENNHFASLLEAKLHEKAHEMKCLAQNRSRHFRSVKTTVEELSQHGKETDTSTDFQNRCGNDPNVEYSGNLGWDIRTRDRGNWEPPCYQQSEVYRVTVASGMISPDGEIPFTETRESGTSRDQSVAQSSGASINFGDCDKLLKDILKRKQKEASAHLLNRSRHFRTMETAVEELTEMQAKSCDIIEPDPKSIPPPVTVDCDISTCTCGPATTSGGPSMSDNIASSNVTESGSMTKQFVISAESGIKPSEILDHCSIVRSNLHHLGGTLCHGMVAMMHLAVEAAANQVCDDVMPEADTANEIKVNQSEATKFGTKSRRFDHTCVHSVCFPGLAPHNSCIIQGMVVMATKEQLCIMSQARKPLKALVINGDISPAFRHKGYKQSVSTSVVVGEVSASSSQQMWLEEVLEVVHQLEISLVLVKGTVEDSVVHRCQSLAVVVLQALPYKVLLAVAEACDVDMATYISECTQANVAHNVYLEAWSCDWLMKTGPKATSGDWVLLKLQNNIIQTAIICHPVEAVCRLQEEQFWHCVYRLHNVMAGSKVLPGQGATEVYCSHLLSQLADGAEREDKANDLLEWMDCFRPVVYRTLAEAFHDYAARVAKNQGSQNLDQVNHCRTKCVRKEQDSSEIFDLSNEQTVILEKETRSECHVFDTIQGLDVKSNEEDRRKNLSTKGRLCGADLLKFQVLDDFLSKTEAWKNALHLLCVILQTDYEIVTGIESVARKTGSSVDASVL